MEIRTVDKVRLRSEMKQKRDALTAAGRAKKSADIVRKLTGQTWYGANDSILVYSAIRSEVDLALFCQKAWSDGKRLYFPRVTGDDMEFYEVDSPKQLESGCFGVLEPRLRDGRADRHTVDCDAVYAGERWCSPAAEEVPVLVPGVAFSKKGQRIGYGKGYYDRYLQNHAELMPVGVCFELQIADVIEADAHDYPMKQIVTETAIYHL